MSARDWMEKDFYAELGVPSSASADEIKRAYRKLARELHPDANPGDAKAEARFKAVSEAYGVLSDVGKRKQYDETRRLFASGGFRPGPASGGFGSGGASFDFGDLFSNANSGGTGGIGDLLGGLFGRRGGAAGATSATRAQRGADAETDITVDFVDAVNGATVSLRLSSPATCGTCGGSGARPGTFPETCGTCSGSGLISRSQGAFAFSEPCRDCHGSGRIIKEPCGECAGSGVSTRTRSLSVRIPPGVDDGQRIRLAGQGEPGRNGAPAGDLYVRVHVTPHPIFGRSGNDITITVPCTFPELVLGTTLTVPTLDGKVSLKVPPGTANGRTLRVRGKGITRKDGSQGDLLVALQVTVPSIVDDAARKALEDYAAATAEQDPRPALTALFGRDKP